MNDTEGKWEENSERETERWINVESVNYSKSGREGKEEMNGKNKQV